MRIPGILYLLDPESAAVTESAHPARSPEKLPAKKDCGKGAPVRDIKRTQRTPGETEPKSGDRIRLLIEPGRRSSGWEHSWPSKKKSLVK
jgi:hypothetical protein